MYYIIDKFNKIECVLNKEYLDSINVYLLELKYKM